MYSEQPISKKSDMIKKIVSRVNDIKMSVSTKPSEFRGVIFYMLDEVKKSPDVVKKSGYITKLKQAEKRREFVMSCIH